MTGGWRPTRALGRALGVGLLVLVGAVALGRGDLAVLGVPLLGAAVWPLVTRPTRAPGVTTSVDPLVVAEGERFTWRVDVEPVEGLRDVVAHLPADRWGRSTPRHGHVAASADGASRGELVPLGIDVEAVRWGARRLGPAQLAAFGDLAGVVWVSPAQPEAVVTAVPRPGRFSSRAGLPHPSGLVGQHRSNRQGSGTELADLRPFRTGDRLRRISWPVSLRTGQLHVTTTHADQDAEVRLVVDALRDVGLPDLERERRSSLDTAVDAAGALAAHYLSTGDRVGLSVLGGGRAVDVPAVGGHHQLTRLLLALGRAEPTTGSLVEERALRAQLRRSVPPGAVVVLLSALVSAEPLAHAVRLARSGHVVIVVDTLPPHLATAAAEPDDVVAATGIEDPRLAGLTWRLRLLEREREARRCAQAGVPVVAWSGDGSLDSVLRGIGRRPRTAGAAR
ncbi:DUF58 domain-containing protein [Phycicoccus sonneratiae]|uniref:DUF58 domain-containing protein n=1 Tax=Phycicoccus sonneratiae TaxID=2807628 RepID=A0ABS2CGQ9_9MICO|nr:DUF58 domain-containing protein [Phycicoccus sonneraticus]MBM6399062.1 DUF58 domain-containing protein [Phycicoccus sonneraticus]